MSPAPSLRRQLTLGLLAYTLLFTLAVAAQGYFVNENAESLVWESMLGSELDHFQARRIAEPGYRWADTETLKLFGGASGKPIPAEFARLTPGVHDELRTAGGEFVVLVRGEGAERVALALEITEMEQAEQRVLSTIALSSLALVALLVLIAFFGAGRLVRPLTALANSIAALTPDRYGQRVALDRRAPREAVVIAEGLNQYLDQLDRFVEREREFVRTASHELRTPLAVICGSAELALDALASQRPGEAHVRNVLSTAQEMLQLVALLLALAKDPSRLKENLEPVDLADLLPAVLESHRFLAGPKELTFDLSVTGATHILAPRAVAQAAIGNLVRNAVENSARGQIRVAIEGQRVVIEDPGRGMTDDELSQIYTRLAREGATAGGGVGIELIARLCEHLGWKMTLASQAGRGTRVTLQFA